MGYSYIETDGDAITHAFLWTEEGGLQDLGRQWDLECGAWGINSIGQIVGLLGASFTSAFVWSQGAMQTLGTLGGDNSSAAGINDLGDIVGSSTTTSSDVFSHAFVWTQARGMRDLGTLGGNKSGTWGVDMIGRLSVYSSVPGNDNVFHAFLWTSASGLQDLGTLEGTPLRSSHKRFRRYRGNIEPARRHRAARVSLDKVQGHAGFGNAWWPQLNCIRHQ